jgi:ATP-binding cassette, subfamily B, bacterial
MFSQFSIIWSIMRGFRMRYGLALGCLVLATVINFGIPLVASATIDYAVSNKVAGPGTPCVIALVLHFAGGPARLRAHIWLAPVMMVTLSLISGLFTFLKGWQASLASDGIARRLKNELYDHLGHLPAVYHDRTDTGDLVQRCTSDVETTRLFLATQIMEIGNAVILAAAAFPLLLSLNIRLALVSFVLVPPIPIYGYVYFRKVKHVFKSVEEAEGALTAVIQENLTGIRVVRAFARQDFEREKFAVPNGRYRDRNVLMLRLMSWYWSISDLVALTQIGLVLFVGAHWVVTGTLSVGVLFAFLAYLAIMLWPVRQMGRILTDLGKTSVALNRIREVLAVEREVDAPAPAPYTPAGPLRGALSVRHLRFAHASQAEGSDWALDDVSFSVAPGETLAILGPSGAGKSTLIHLLLRLYDYSQGSILLDGAELASLPRKWVRSRIGAVMQEPFLFSKSLKDNLKLGRDNALEHEIENAARAACIHETILSFDQGYGTLIGERGITLSGGQRQRVAIARAVLRHPPILVLDDALSAVDGETESLILDALKERHGRATTLVIAHRLSTLVHADRIIVLDRGRIVQTGTHAELASAEGLYRRLWEIQTRNESAFTRETAAT